MNEGLMEVSVADQNTLERLEEELWREDTRFDQQRMNELVAGDFFSWTIWPDLSAAANP